MRIFLLASVLAGLLFASGCNRQSDRDATVAPVQVQAWLRDHLPEQTFAYIRLPTPWQWLSSADGRPLDAALRHPAHRQAMEQLRAAVMADPLLGGNPAGNGAWQLLDSMTSPLEFALIGAGGQLSPASQVLLSVSVRQRDAAELNALLTTWAEAAGHVTVAEPIDAGTGLGTLRTAQGQVVRLHFDASQQRLLMLAGMTTAASDRPDALPRAQPASLERLARLESRIDQSGLGGLVWFDVNAMQAVRAMAGAGADRPGDWLINETESFAMGWGVVDGEGRIGMHMDLRDDARLLQFLPRPDREPTLATAGTPRSAFRLTLPSPVDVARIETALDAELGEPALADWRAMKAKLPEAAGFDLDTLLGAIGPDVWFIHDEAGSYTALRLRDRARFDALLAGLQQRFGLRHDTRSIEGRSHHHLAIGFDDMTSKDDARSDLAITLLNRMHSHVYWMEHGDYLLLADVPQILIDHQAASAQPLSDWLRERQGIDPATSLLAMSTRAEQGRRFAYHLYLQGLSLLGDLSGKPIDLYTLPSFGSLDLALDTPLGLRLHADTRSVGLDLIYGQTPLEALSGSGMATVAMGGIAAAIALPAYQDYVARAQATAALAASASWRLALAEHYAATGKLSGEPDGLPSGQPTQHATIQVDAGAIVIEFGPDAAPPLRGRHLVLWPYADADGLLHFRCGEAAIPPDLRALADETAVSAGEAIADRHLPAQCRP